MHRRTASAHQRGDLPAPLVTSLLDPVLRERRFQGTLCYAADNYRAVIEDGYEPLHAGTKMKLLVDPSG
jgi:(R,R)-butanediol dehydrogenase/meso-butanediol dehydrogenase/diacetyl reductase